MDTCIPATGGIPVRRPKSWKREREESRAKHTQRPRDSTNILVWDLPHLGMSTGVYNYNDSSVNFINRSFTSSQQIKNKLSSRLNDSTCVKNVHNLFCGIKGRKVRVFRRADPLNCSKDRWTVPTVSNSVNGRWNSLNITVLNREFSSDQYLKKVDLIDHLKSEERFSEDNLGNLDLQLLIPTIKGMHTEESPEEKQLEVSVAGESHPLNRQYPLNLNLNNKECPENMLTGEGEKQGNFSVGQEPNSRIISSSNKGHMETNEGADTDGVRKRVLPYHQKCRNHCSEQNIAMLQIVDNSIRCTQSAPKLSTNSDNLKRKLSDISILDAYLQRQIHAAGSFGDSASCKCNILTENINDNCVLLNETTSICHNGECDFMHKYSLTNGLIGYILDSNHAIQTFTVAQKTVNAVENTAVDISEEDLQDVTSYFFQAQQRIFIKSKLRSINYNAALQRPDDRHFTKLDSSLKRNTAFVRKLKSFTSNQLDSLLKDMSSLNLSKYISEVAAALVECKLKMSDIWPAVQLCNIFHQTYSDFSAYFLENWQKVLSIRKDEPISNPAKLRVDLRFYAELISVGIFTRKEGLSLIGNILTLLTCMDKEDHCNIKIILSFCRHCGDEYAGLVSRKVRLLSEKYNIAVPQNKLLTEEKQHNVRVLFKDYYNSLCNHLLKEHRKLQEISKQNKRILHTKGELGLERKDRLESIQASFNQIAADTQLLAEALDEDFPLLCQDESLKQDGITFSGNGEGDENTQDIYLWDDEEERCFYECFPDVKQFVPSLQIRTPEPEQVSEEALDLEFDGDLFGETPSEEVLIEKLEEAEETEPTITGNSKALLFLSTLPKCITKDLIDKASIEFVKTLNTKHNRRRLVKTLFTVPRIRLDLLPYYARFVATLHPVASDVAVDLAQMLRQSFQYHIQKKDQINIESKIKVVRFIGELVKFNMYSKVEGLYCLKVLVQDFNHHHIEMCCNFLESCGKFFFRHPYCNQRMKIYLDQMMRKKAVMALGPRYVTMIENVYYFVNPPQETKCVPKVRLDEEEFIRMLLYHKLGKLNVEEVLCLMQKLDWDESHIASYAVKCLTRAYKVKYYNIRYLASLLAGLVVDHEFEGTQVIDGVLEDIQLGMELNIPEHNQRRMAMIKYLGELYNYRLVENSNIFRVLHSLITFDVTYDHSVISVLDPPESLFRIRLICTLLETCGEYFSSGISRKKLDLYLICFQYYYWFKFSHPFWCERNPFPCAVTFMFQDTVKRLRPNIQMFLSFSEAEEAMSKLWVQCFSLLESQCCDHYMPTAAPFSDDVNHLESESDESTGPQTEDIGIGAAGSNTEVSQSLSKSSILQESIKGYMDTNTDSECGGCHTDVICNENIIFYKSESDSQWEVVETKDEVMTCGPNIVICPEDNDFLIAFDRMVSDNLRDRMHEIVKPQIHDITVPLHVKGRIKKSYIQLRKEEDTDASMDFLLILRKGNKQQFKNLAVPMDSEIALNMKNHKEAERVEKERMKRLTLNINDRLEEEDYQEMLAQTQRPTTINFNRERKHRYQHPKGAPDADLIFSSQKVR